MESAIFDHLWCGRIHKRETAQEPKITSLGHAYNVTGYGKTESRKHAIVVANWMTRENISLNIAITQGQVCLYHAYHVHHHRNKMSIWFQFCHTFLSKCYTKEIMQNVFVFILRFLRFSTFFNGIVSYQPLQLKTYRQFFGV